MTPTPCKLRVLHVIDSLAGSGGAENRLVDEVVALRQRFDQAVVRLYEKDGLDARLNAAGIEVTPLGFSANRAGRSWAWAALRLRAVIRRWGPDVVHTSLFSANLVGQLAATSLDIPVVSTFNRAGEHYRRPHQSRRVKVMQAIGRWSDERGDVHYRAVGSHARYSNCASTGLDFGRCTVVPRGIELTTDDLAADRGRFGLPSGVPLFVNVARRVPEKAQQLLVAAFAKVRVELPEARLAIAGASGTADRAIERAIDRAGVSGWVHILGFRPDARSLVASADVFAFSSLSEGSPGAVVEALALGVPVAAFDIPPVVELTDAGRHAWLAPAGSVDGLADAMIAAFGAADRADRVRAAQCWAQRFRLEAVADQLGDLLEARARAGAGAKP